MQYPPWVVDSEGMIILSFRTSESDALLLYMETGTSRQGYFRVRLLNGALNIDLSRRPSPFQMYEHVVEVLGEHLNDNRLHNVSVIRNRASNQYEISLDNVNSVTISLGATSTATGSLYIGGVPKTLVPVTDSLLDDTHFIGCLEDIKYSNTSILIDQLEHHAPVVENGVRENCVDPCSGVNCGSGVCVPRWPTGFCNCQATDLLGVSCTEGK